MTKNGKPSGGPTAVSVSDLRHHVMAVICDSLPSSYRQLHHHHRSGLQDPNGGNGRGARQAADLGHGGAGEIPNNHLDVTNRFSSFFCMTGCTVSLQSRHVGPTSVSLAATTGTPTASSSSTTWRIQSRSWTSRGGWTRSQRTVTTSARSWVGQTRRLLTPFQVCYISSQYKTRTTRHPEHTTPLVKHGGGDGGRFTFQQDNPS